MLVGAGARGQVRRAAAVLAEGSFDDPENARIILLAAGGLVLLAVLVGLGTLWWWRTVKVEHPALAPLEVMGTRSWWKGDYTSRRRRLEDARPAGAQPFDAVPASSDDPVDLEAAALASPPEFDDLLEVPLSGEGALAEVAAAGAQPDAVAAVVVEAAAGEAVEGEVVGAEVPVPAPAVAAPPVIVVAAGAPTEDAGAIAHEVAHVGADDTSVSAEVPRPIDPLLRMQQSE